MKVAAVTILALCCVLGVALAQYGYSPYGTSSGGSGMAIMGIGLVFLLLMFTLFTQTKSVPLIVGNISTGVNVPVTVG